MRLKYFLIFLIFFAIQSPRLLAQKEQKMFESDTNAHCQCLEDLEKESQRKKKKSKRTRKKKKRSAGQRPVAGDSIEVRFQDCLVKRRSVKTRNMLLNMTQQEQIAWKEKVLQNAKEQCPRLYSRVLK